MPRPSAAWLVALYTVMVFVCAPAPSRAEPQIDLALVLAVDASGSMRPDEEGLQRQGYAEAFRSPKVHRAIHNGVLGRIAIIYFEWSGPSDQLVITPWSLIETPENALAFAERLESGPAPRSFGGTSISGAIDFSVALLNVGPFTAIRQVIDISGNGVSSHGRLVTQARDEAISRGITINGLPIKISRPDGTPGSIDLDEYYRNCVIGGPGAFIVPVRDHQHMTEAIRTKVVQEIANISSEPLIRKVHAGPRSNCSVEISKRNPRR